MTIPACPGDGEFVEQEIDRVLTQYRESPNLLGLMRTLLGKVEDVIQVACTLPEHFDLNTAVGDQLTLIGKRLGWPRCHCTCEVAPVFGFKCNGADTHNGMKIVGFCEGGTWSDCEAVGQGELCLWDDEVYRGFLRARRYQVLGLYDVGSLTDAARHIWGATASVVSSSIGSVTVAPGRTLSAEELKQVPLVFRVLPIAPGIRGFIHHGTGLVAGFGEGWGGFCEGAKWLCPQDPYTYSCP